MCVLCCYRWSINVCIFVCVVCMCIYNIDIHRIFISCVHPMYVQNGWCLDLVFEWFVLTGPALHVWLQIVSRVNMSLAYLLSVSAVMIGFKVQLGWWFKLIATPKFHTLYNDDDRSSPVEQCPAFWDATDPKKKIWMTAKYYIMYIYIYMNKNSP